MVTIHVQLKILSTKIITRPKLDNGGEHILSTLPIILVLILFATSTSCGKNRICKTFNDHAQAQRYFEARNPGWKRLDGDKDGEACECLMGGSSYSTSVCKRWRKKYSLR